MQTISDFGGSVPEFYDRIMGPAQFDRFGAELARRLPAKPPGDVLELACGTGRVTRHLRERIAPGVTIVASDISQAMVDYAKRALGAPPGVEWHEADACKLPFADGAFGAVVCAFGVMFVPDKAACFREARRVLRKGGVFLFDVWDGLENNPQSRATSDVIEAMFPNDPEMKFRGPFEFNDKAKLGSMLAEERFGDVRMEAVRLEIGCPSARDYAVGQLKGTPRGALLAKRGVAVEDLIDRIADALAAVGGRSPFKALAQALVIEARAI